MNKFKEYVKQIIKRIGGAQLSEKNKRTEEEQRFIKAWTDIFTSNADVFTGLYASLEKVSNGTAKKPERVLKEWRGRTRYKWENEPIYKITEKFLETLADDYKKWADLLLEAAENAGIVKDEEKYLTLDESNANAYTEWDGEELTVEDTVEIISSARYQNGRVLEQGYCRKMSSDEANSVNKSKKSKKKGKGKIIAIIIAAVIVILIVVFFALANWVSSSRELIETHYSYENGTLTVSGQRAVTTSTWHALSDIERDDVEKVIITDGVTSIDNFAFNDCVNLTSVEIPDSVTEIGKLAFYGCKSLRSIEIPNSVTKIGRSILNECDSLEHVYYTGSEEEWSKIKINKYNDDLINKVIFNYGDLPSGE